MRAMRILVGGMLLALALAARAQSAGGAPDSADDGTDPTRLNATAALSYEHLDLRKGKRPDTLSLRGILPLPRLGATSIQLEVQLLDF
jgi:hypothetical protein